MVASFHCCTFCFPAFPLQATQVTVEARRRRKGKEAMFYGCLHSSNRSLVHLLDRWGLQCRSVPLKTFQGVARSERVQIEGPSEAIMTSNHTIHLWEITRRDSGTEWKVSLMVVSRKRKLSYILDQIGCWNSARLTPSKKPQKPV